MKRCIIVQKKEPKQLHQDSQVDASRIYKKRARKLLSDNVIRDFIIEDQNLRKSRMHLRTICLKLNWPQHWFINYFFLLQRITDGMCTYVKKRQQSFSVGCVTIIFLFLECKKKFHHLQKRKLCIINVDQTCFYDSIPIGKMLYCNSGKKALPSISQYWNLLIWNQRLNTSLDRWCKIVHYFASSAAQLWTHRILSVLLIWWWRTSVFLLDRPGSKAAWLNLDE